LAQSGGSLRRINSVALGRKADISERIAWRAPSAVIAARPA
jgi:hypothetical protein